MSEPLVRRIYNKSAQITTTMLDQQSHFNNTTTAFGIEESIAKRNQQANNTLDTAFFENLLSAEEKINKKRISQDLINEVIGLYAKCVEYYDSIKDPIKFYFLEKIQITLTSKESLKLIFSNNGSQSARSLNNSNSAKRNQDDLINSQAPKQSQSKLQEDIKLDKNYLQTSNQTFRKSNTLNTQFPSSFLTQQIENTRSFLPTSEEQNEKSESSQVQQQGNENTSSLNQSLKLEEKKKGKFKFELDFKKLHKNLDPPSENLNIPVNYSNTSNNNYNNNNENNNNNYDNNDNNQYNNNNINEINMRNDTMAQKRNQNLKREEEMIENNRMSTIGETKESVRLSTNMSFDAWNNKVDLNMLNEESFVSLLNGDQNESMIEEFQNKNKDFFPNQSEFEEKQISPLISFIEEDHYSPQQEVRAAQLNVPQISYLSPPLVTISPPSSSAADDMNKPQTPQINVFNCDDKKITIQDEDNSKQLQKNIPNYTLFKVKQSYQVRVILFLSKSSKSLNHSRENSNVSRQTEESEEAYSIPLKRAERSKRFSLFIAMRNERNHSEIKQDFSKILNRFEIDSQVKDEIVKEDINYQMDQMNQRIKKRKSKFFIAKIENDFKDSKLINVKFSKDFDFLNNCRQPPNTSRF